MLLRDTFIVSLMEDELIRDEGLMLHVYKDPGSGHAIGVGRNLDTQGISSEEREHLGITDEMLKEGGPGISRDQAMGLLRNDISDRAHQLDVRIPWWRLLTVCRQRVLLNMAFEMGTSGMLSEQADAIKDIMGGDYHSAAAHMMLTPWGTGKTKNRAFRLTQMLVLDKPV